MLSSLKLRGQQGTPETFLRAMLTIRSVETALMEAYLEKRFEGPLHVSIGQEGVAVGVVTAMGLEDVLLSNHRGHGHALAFGLDPVRMVAEVVGEPHGYAGGKGGSMHIADPELGFFGTNGIVGDSAGLAVGVALAAQQSSRKRKVVAIVGDGAMSSGIVFESLNLAKLWNLPMVLVCENNHYAEMTPTKVHLSSPPSERAKGFGLGTFTANGDDVEEVAKTMRKALGQVHSQGPAFVEVSTYRIGGHYVGDAGLYRPAGEEEEWRMQHDPVRYLVKRSGQERMVQTLEQELLQSARELVNRILNHEYSALAP